MQTFPADYAVKNFIKMKYSLQLSLVAILLTGNLFSQVNLKPNKTISTNESSVKVSNGNTMKQLYEENRIDLGSFTPDQLPEVKRIIEQMMAEKEKNPASDELNKNIRPTGPFLSVNQERSSKNLYNRRGQLLFTNLSNRTPSMTGREKVPDSYILGVGDQLNISIFGASQYDAQFEIGPSGFIQPSGMAKIFLKGVKFKDAQELIRNRFKNTFMFQKEQFLVSIISPRYINVNVLGEVDQNGVLSLSGVNTVIDALNAAGGPGEIGSLRTIKLIREQETIEVDLYMIMDNPSLKFQYYLEDGDIIHVPIANKVIDFMGEVQRPMSYELKDNENLQQLLEFAGGLKASAYKKIIQVRRFTNGREILLDVPLEKLLNTQSDFKLQNGDRVMVKAISGQVDNFVSIAGAVTFPGDYSLSNTPNISTLLKKGELLKEAKKDIAFLIRKNEDGTNKLIQVNLKEIIDAPSGTADLFLQKGDRLKIYEQERFTDKLTISVTGAVREPVEYPFDPEASITISRAILLAGGLKSEADNFGYVIRTNPQNIKEREYIKVNIQSALNTPLGIDNIKLQPLDELKVLDKSSFSDVAKVRVTGAVRNPGEFLYDESLNLKDIITLSGGLSFGAALNRIDLFRISMNGNEATRTIVKTLEIDSTLQNTDGTGLEFELQPYDEIIVRKIPNFEFQKFVTLEGEVKYPGQYALLNDNETIFSLLKRSGGLTPEAFPEGANLIRKEENKGLIVTQINKILEDTTSKFNYIMKDGDLLTIPKKDNLVAIITENTRAIDLYPDKFLQTDRINVAYDDRKKANWYIKEYATGFGEHASKRKVTVEHANGKLKRTKRAFFIKFYPKVEPGSTISVGAKPSKSKKQKKARKAVDWGEVLSNVFQSVTLGVTTILLVKQL